MARNATQRDNEPQRANLSLVGDRKPDRRTELDDLRMELAALHAERHDLGQELAYWSRLLLKAVHLDRSDMTEHASGRLEYLSGRLVRQSEGS